MSIQKFPDEYKFCSHVYSDVTGGAFYLTFVCMPKEGDAKCVGRLVFSRDHMIKFVDMLNRQLKDDLEKEIPESV